MVVHSQRPESLLLNTKEIIGIIQHQTGPFVLTKILITDISVRCNGDILQNYRPASFRASET